MEYDPSSPDAAVSVIAVALHVITIRAPPPERQIQPGQVSLHTPQNSASSMSFRSSSQSAQTPRRHAPAHPHISVQQRAQKIRCEEVEEAMEADLLQVRAASNHRRTAESHPAWPATRGTR